MLRRAWREIHESDMFSEGCQSKLFLQRIMKETRIVKLYMQYAEENERGI